MAEFEKNFQNWCNDSAFDEETKNELRALSDPKEIEDRFYKDLEFGTAGLRGVMGAGTNRMNQYTVGRATMGLGRYLIRKFSNAKEAGVVIGYDTRNRSAEFAKNAADVLTAMGIPVKLFNQPVPTPTLSFAVRHFGAVSGIVITASHNPPQYNGFKAYDETGCQLGIEAAEEVLKEVNGITDWSSLPETGCNELLQSIGDEVLDLFTTTVLRQSTLKDKDAKKNLKLVYTPIHGSGWKPVCQILEKDGFTDVTLVEEQTLPDGNFPTVKSPNPEDRGALQMGIDLAETIGADLVIGTDPDADRVGCAVRKGGQMFLLSGNQVGALLVDFILKTKTVLGQNPVVINTIVSSDLGRCIAEKNGCTLCQVLTGFKFIGEKITLFESEQKAKLPEARHFVLGYEESYGYLAGTHARDKDAVVASMLIAEMAAFHKKEGRTLLDALDGLYREFGYYLDTLDSFALQGKEGLERIAEIMAEIRRDHSFLPKVTKALDYQEGVEDLPRANVLKFYFEGGSWLAARPSGTEPKIKFYYSIRENDKEKAEKTLAELKQRIREKTGL